MIEGLTITEDDAGTVDEAVDEAVKHDKDQGVTGGGLEECFFFMVNVKNARDPTKMPGTSGPPVVWLRVFFMLKNTTKSNHQIFNLYQKKLQ